ncbi:MAG: 2-phosphosulfolactate phosphatase [Leucobacter sp.]
MTDPRSQSTYQVRLGWGSGALTRLATAGIVIIVDAIGSSEDLAAAARALPHAPTVYLGSLRNATATARAAYEEQVARGGRTAINLVLAGDGEGGFAVEDYLAAGAIADGLAALGIDHSAPDVAVANEGFRPLKRAVKHLFSASAAGLALKAAGRGDEAKAAAELDAESEAVLR